MFKKVTKITLAGIIGVGTMVGSSSLVLAAESGPYNSEANVEFEVNKGKVTPTFPGEDSDNPFVDFVLDPENPVEIQEGTAGPLSIDYASHFHFGEIEIISDAQNYKANPVGINLEEGTTTVAPYVQVTDNTGENAGWTLQAAQTQFVNDGVELDGATITLTEAGTVTSLNAIDNSEDISGNTQNLVLTTDAIDIAKADALTPGGTYLNSFGTVENVGVELDIPAGTQINEGTYSSDITWTLGNTPTE